MVDEPRNSKQMPNRFWFLRVPLFRLLAINFAAGAALAAVEIQHRRILRDAGERGADHALRDARGRGLRRDTSHEGVEIAAAAGGEGRGGEEEGGENGRAQGKCKAGIKHGESHS